jgi:hypothetical protein
LRQTNGVARSLYAAVNSSIAYFNCSALMMMHNIAFYRK